MKGWSIIVCWRILVNLLGVNIGVCGFSFLISYVSALSVLSSVFGVVWTSDRHVTESLAVRPANSAYQQFAIYYIKIKSQSRGQLKPPYTPKKTAPSLREYFFEYISIKKHTAMELVAPLLNNIPAQFRAGSRRPNSHDPTSAKGLPHQPPLCQF